MADTLDDIKGLYDPSVLLVLACDLESSQMTLALATLSSTKNPIATHQGPTTVVMLWSSLSSTL